jgi:hypothetical protein
MQWDRMKLICMARLLVFAVDLEMSRSLLKISGGSINDYAIFSALLTRPSC